MFRYCETWTGICWGQPDLILPHVWTRSLRTAKVNILQGEHTRICLIWDEWKTPSNANSVQHAFNIRFLVKSIKSMDLISYEFLWIPMISSDVPVTFHAIEVPPFPVWDNGRTPGWPLHGSDGCRQRHRVARRSMRRLQGGEELQGVEPGRDLQGLIYG